MLLGSSDEEESSQEIYMQDLIPAEANLDIINTHMKPYDFSKASREDKINLERILRKTQHIQENIFGDFKLKECHEVSSQFKEIEDCLNHVNQITNKYNYEKLESKEVVDQIRENFTSIFIKEIYRKAIRKSTNASIRELNQST